MTSAQLMPASRSLTLIRDLDSLSPAIRSAMTAESIIPVVEINTPAGTVTLLNAKVVNMSPSRPPAGRQGWIELYSWQFGAGQTSVGGHVGGGSGAGKVNFGDFDVGKNVSAETLRFSFEKLLAGIHHRRH